METNPLIYNHDKLKAAVTGEKTFQKGWDIPQIVRGERLYYFLVSGFVRMYLTTACGHELTLLIYRPGSLFSLSAFFAPQERIFYLEAYTRAHLLLIPQKNLLQLIINDPEILRVLCGRYTLTLHRLYQRLSQAYYSTARNRVISALYYLVKLFGENGNNKVRFTNRITHEDIAAIAGLTRENTSRELEKLEEERILVLKYGKLIISDLEKLDRLASLDKKIIIV